MEGRADANWLHICFCTDNLQTIGLIQILSVREYIIYKLFLWFTTEEIYDKPFQNWTSYFFYINKMLIRMYPGCWTVAKTGDPLKYPNGVSAGYLSELG